MTLAQRPHPVLEVLDLRIGFPQSVAVHGITFTIEHGKTMALVGESGRVVARAPPDSRQGHLHHPAGADDIP